ncbi:MAG: sensor histidine kinase, partial [Caldanaerobacter sp.]
INLIDNGIKYTQEGGFVKVKTASDQEKIIIEIEDNGIGIPKDKIPRLFERFYRVDKSRSRKLGGTGLGLAIVKHIVESMKGEISVDSEVGKGTKFTIKFEKRDLIRK